MNFDIINKLADKYKLTIEDRKEFYNIIKNFLKHDEFQRRFTSEFLHHDNVTLGEHIIEVAIETFIISKKTKNNIDLELTLNIAMMHDLYSTSWNNEDSAVDIFSNKHAFRHPIESVINSANWFPDIYDKSDSYKLIDGIAHHMFPIHVVSFKDSEKNDLELRNFDLIEFISNKANKQLQISTYNNGHKMILRPSKYKEGIIVSNADKIVTINNLKGSKLNKVVKELIVGEKVKSLDNKKKK